MEQRRWPRRQSKRTLSSTLPTGTQTSQLFTEELSLRMTWKLTEEMVRASPVAQWLRIHLAMEGIPCSILGSWKIPHAAAQLNRCARITEPASRAPQIATTETMCCNYAPAYPRAMQLELYPVLCSKRNCCNEKHSLQLEKTCMQQQRLITAKK